MEHTERYLQAKWVTENPKGYDERDVAHANSYCEAYLEGYNQALSIANVVGRSKQLVCDCENCKPFPNHAAGFRKNKTCIKEKAN